MIFQMGAIERQGQMSISQAVQTPKGSSPEKEQSLTVSVLRNPKATIDLLNSPAS